MAIVGLNTLVAPRVRVFMLMIVAFTCARSDGWREVLLDADQRSSDRSIDPGVHTMQR